MSQGQQHTKRPEQKCLMRVTMTYSSGVGGTVLLCGIILQEPMSSCSKGVQILGQTISSRRRRREVEGKEIT